MATDRLSELEQEIMQSDYDDEIAKVLKLADEDPGIQEFSLAAPAAKLKALSALLSTGASKVIGEIRRFTVNYAKPWTTRGHGSRF